MVGDKTNDRPLALLTSFATDFTFAHKENSLFGTIVLKEPFLEGSLNVIFCITWNYIKSVIEHNCCMCTVHCAITRNAQKFVQVFIILAGVSDGS